MPQMSPMNWMTISLISITAMTFVSSKNFLMKANHVMSFYSNIKKNTKWMW